MQLIDLPPLMAINKVDLGGGGGGGGGVRGGGRGGGGGWR
jgi:hypothetical protein